MHALSIPPHVLERVIRRAGRPHPFDVIEPAKTALVVIDMQNYFMKPGFQGEVPMAREIVPTVNRLAAATRELGGHVVWVRNTTSGTRESWSVLHDWLQTPNRALGGAIPLDLLNTDLGAEEVVTILDGIERGVYS